MGWDCSNSFGRVILEPEDIRLDYYSGYWELRILSLGVSFCLNSSLIIILCIFVLKGIIKLLKREIIIQKMEQEVYSIMNDIADSNNVSG